MGTVSRREFLAGTAAAVALSGTEPAWAESRAGVPLTLRQGTNLAARLSPDGRTIAIDLLGVLWLVPASGGPAKRLTGDDFDIAQPDWSPDGATLAFQSFRDGNFHIWTIRRDGSGLRQLTTGPYDHR